MIDPDKYLRVSGTITNPETGESSILDAMVHKDHPAIRDLLESIWGHLQEELEASQLGRMVVKNTEG